MPGAAKNFESPDETRPFEGKGEAQLVNLGGKAIGRGVFEPGWKWSENVKPIARTDSCHAHHVGYCVSGGMTIHMNDGTTFEIHAGTFSTSLPGTTPRCPGMSPASSWIFSGFGDYAKRT